LSPGSISGSFDRYQWNVRVLPGLVVLLPLCLAILAWVDQPADAVKPLLVVVMGSGVLVPLSNITRDLGRKAQKQLMEEWGCWPSTAILRHADSRISDVRKARCHSILALLVPGVKIPSAEEETRDPKAADAIYESCADFVRATTRDQHQFAILFSENVEFGYRRNMLGIKPIGVVLGSLGLGVCGMKLWSDQSLGKQVSSIALISTILDIFLMLFWLLAVNENYALAAANSYAYQLIDAIDLLGHQRSKRPTQSSSSSKKKLALRQGDDEPPAEKG
jgi:uncharacterized membrane protein